MIYSDDLTNYFSGIKINISKLNGHEKYTWRFLTLFAKYYKMPWDWDSKWPKDIRVLPPKMIKDIECMELLEPRIYENHEANEKQNKITSKNQSPYIDTTGMTASAIQQTNQFIEAIPPQDRQAVIATFNVPPEPPRDKPIKSKEDLAGLLGTDPALFEIVKEDV